MLGFRVVNKSKEQEQHVLLPLLTCLSCLQSEEALASWDLESGAVQQQTIANALYALGESLTLEDLVRGINSLLTQQGLTKRQRSELARLCESAYDLKQQLLGNEELLRVREQELQRVAAEAVKLLSPAELRELSDNRDRQAIVDLESVYWQAVIAELKRLP